MRDQRPNTQGYTLLEVMVAVGILAVLLVGIGQALLQANYANMVREDRVIAFKASHQVVEELLSLDLDTMILQDGNTFTVGSADYPTNTQALQGNVTVTDLQWDGLTDKAYMLSVTVDDFAVELRTVRTRY